RRQVLARGIATGGEEHRLAALHHGDEGGPFEFLRGLERGAQFRQFGGGGGLVLRRQGGEGRGERPSEGRPPPPRCISRAAARRRFTGVAMLHRDHSLLRWVRFAESGTLREAPVQLGLTAWASAGFTGARAPRAAPATRRCERVGAAACRRA